MECDAPHLPVTGDLPRELRGTLFRNGPNPQFAPLDPMSNHWFSGDGMLHGFTLQDGRASYRNRGFAGQMGGGARRRQVPYLRL